MSISMSNVILAKDWLSKGYDVKINGNHLVKCSKVEKLHRLVSPTYRENEITKIAQFVLANVESSEENDKGTFLALGNALIKSDQRSRTLVILDREMAPHRPEIKFFNSKNASGLKKWERNGLPPEIFQKHPSFCAFLENSKIMSQLKVTRDTVQEIDGEAALLVQGEWMKWPEIEDKFTFEHVPRYNETMVTDKATNEVYTYLDNGKGLQIHHPYFTERTPISTLNDDEYNSVLEKAQNFVRPGEEALSLEERAELNESRTFVIQLVSSHVKGPNTNFHDLLIRSKHPYLRVIIGADNAKMNTVKGEVYEVGYGWQKKMYIPFISTQGQFRSPDVWEYNPCEERIVTNIPVTQQEVNALNQYTANYHRRGVNLGKPIAFHITRQNCSSYVNAALKVVGVNIPTDIALTDLIKEIAPDCLKRVGAFFSKANQKSRVLLGKLISVFPTCIKNLALKIDSLFTRAVTAIAEAIGAFTINLMRVPLGAASGAGGEAFVDHNAERQNLGPDVNNINKWYKLSSYRFNLPGVIQRWQREQNSTEYYKNPMKLAIVPQ